MRKLVLILVVLAASFGTVQLPPAAAQDTTLSCPPWTDNPIVGGQTPIRAQHINELRTCLDLVLGALNAIPPPPPPGGSCTEDLGTLTTGQVTRTGSWNGSCLARGGSSEFSRFYTFTLSQDATVEGTLMSPTVRPFMKLYRGTTHMFTAAGGRFVEELSAGAYTLEVNSRHRETGSYTLTLDVRGGTTPPPPPPGPKSVVVSNVVFTHERNGHFHGSYHVSGTLTDTGTAERIRSFRYFFMFYSTDGALLAEIRKSSYLSAEEGGREQFRFQIFDQDDILGWDYFLMRIQDTDGTVPCAGCDTRIQAPAPGPCGIPFGEGVIVSGRCRSGHWWASGPIQQKSLCEDTEREALDYVTLGDLDRLERIGTADYLRRGSGDLSTGARLWRERREVGGGGLYDIRDRLSNVSCF